MNLRYWQKCARNKLLNFLQTSHDEELRAIELARIFNSLVEQTHIGTKWYFRVLPATYNQT